MVFEKQEYGIAWYLREMGLDASSVPAPSLPLDEQGREVFSPSVRSYTYLHDFGNGKYQLVQMKRARPDYQRIREERNVNSKKLDNNISRSRSAIRGIAMCNEWDWFVTVTIDKNRYNRNDLESFHREFAQFLRNQGKRLGFALKYLMVPEQHQKGGWHEHGLIRGLPLEELRLFTLEEKLPYYIRDKLAEGQAVYDWPRYRAKFGFCDLEPIRSQEAVAHYMTKYITKTLAKDVHELGAHTFYASKGLKRPSTMAEGTSALGLKDGDFENEYCSKKWFYGEEGLAQALEYIRPDTAADRLTQDERKAILSGFSK